MNSASASKIVPDNLPPRTTRQRKTLAPEHLTGILTDLKGNIHLGNCDDDKNIHVDREEDLPSTVELDDAGTEENVEVDVKSSVKKPTVAKRKMVRMVSPRSSVKPKRAGTRDRALSERNITPFKPDSGRRLTRSSAKTTSVETSPELLSPIEKVVDFAAASTPRQSNFEVKKDETMPLDGDEVLGEDEPMDINDVDEAFVNADDDVSQLKRVVIADEKKIKIPVAKATEGQAKETPKFMRYLKNRKESVKTASVSTPVVVASTASASVKKTNKLEQSVEKSAKKLKIEKTPAKKVAAASDEQHIDHQGQPTPLFEPIDEYMERKSARSKNLIKGRNVPRVAMLGAAGKSKGKQPAAKAATGGSFDLSTKSTISFGKVRSPAKRAKVVLKKEPVKKPTMASTTTVFDPLAKPNFVFGNSAADLNGGPKNDVFTFKNKDKEPRKIEPFRSNKHQHKAAAVDKLVRKPKLVRPVKKVADDGVPSFMRATASSRARRGT